MAEKTIILNLSFPGVFRIMTAISGYNIVSDGGKISVPPGWYTPLIYGTDFFPAWFECSINSAVRQRAIGSSSMMDLFSKRGWNTGSSRDQG